MGGKFEREKEPTQQEIDMIVPDAEENAKITVEPDGHPYNFVHDCNHGYTTEYAGPWIKS